MSFFTKYVKPNQVLKGAPGPSPWYLRSDPPKLDGAAFEDIGKDDSSWGKYVLKNKHGDAVALINMYCYLKVLDSHRVLIWHPDGQPTNYATTYTRTIDFTIVDLDKAQPIPSLELSLLLMNEKKLYLLVEPQTQIMFQLSMLSELGRHPFEYPSELKNLDELFVLGDSTNVELWNERNGAHLCIFALRPKKSEIEIIPQDWFNQGNLDYGYQWVTRVARDPKSQKVYGEGIRISSFVLDESNRQIDRLW